MMRKELWNQFRYPEDIWPGEDWFLITQLAAKGVKMFGIKQPLVEVYRAEGREGLLISGKENHHRSSIALIKKMRKWLMKENIHEFDPLYKIAIGNRLILGSKANKGLKRFMLLIRGLILNPNSQMGKKMLRQHKFVRLLSRFRKMFINGIIKDET